MIQKQVKETKKNVDTKKLEQIKNLSHEEIKTSLMQDSHIQIDEQIFEIVTKINNFQNLSKEEKKEFISQLKSIDFLNDIAENFQNSFQSIDDELKNIHSESKPIQFSDVPDDLKKMLMELEENIESKKITLKEGENRLKKIFEQKERKKYKSVVAKFFKIVKNEVESSGEELKNFFNNATREFQDVDGFIEGIQDDMDARRKIMDRDIDAEQISLRKLQNMNILLERKDLLLLTIYSNQINKIIEFLTEQIEEDILNSADYMLKLNEVQRLLDILTLSENQLIEKIQDNKLVNSHKEQNIKQKEVTIQLIRDKENSISTLSLQLNEGLQAYQTALTLNSIAEVSKIQKDIVELTETTLEDNNKKINEHLDSLTIKQEETSKKMKESIQKLQKQNDDFQTRMGKIRELHNNFVTESSNLSQSVTEMIEKEKEKQDNDGQDNDGQDR